MSDIKRRLGHISSTDHWVERQENRAEIEARRAADPWPWLDELLAWSKRNGSQMTRYWDPPPAKSHNRTDPQH